MTLEPALTPKHSVPVAFAIETADTIRRLDSGALIHSDRRLPSLTGLRIFAALAVYFSHIGPPHDSPRILSTFFASGYSGVTIFFVLSGFVLAVNYFDGFRRLTAVRGYNYLVARFARVYPLYLLILLYVVVRQHALGESIDGWWRNALAVQTWSPNVAHAYSFDAPGWSIGVEFFLYACFPFLVPLISLLRGPRRILLGIAGVIAAMAILAALFVLSGDASLPITNPDSAHRWLYRTPLTRLGDFALGILASRLFVETRGQRIVGRIGSPLAIFSAATIVCLMAWPAFFFTAWSWDVAYAVPATALIFGLAVAPWSWLARGLALPMIVLLGEASYAFYLVHSPGISILGGGTWAQAMSPTAALYEALILGAIIALALGLHIGFERPSREWLRRLFSWNPRPGKSRELAGRSGVSPET